MSNLVGAKPVRRLIRIEEPLAGDPATVRHLDRRGRLGSEVQEPISVWSGAGAHDVLVCGSVVFDDLDGGLVSRARSAADVMATMNRSPRRKPSLQ